MMLALRRTAAEDATWWQRLFAWATRVRLVSDYCHGGIVINGMMYQVNAARGLHVSATTLRSGTCTTCSAATKPRCCCSICGSTLAMTISACWPQTFEEYTAMLN